MYAVVATGGKQYRVEAGSELIVERLSAEPGAPITFDRILLVGDGEAVTVGTRPSTAPASAAPSSARSSARSSSSSSSSRR